MNTYIYIHMHRCIYYTTACGANSHVQTHTGCTNAHRLYKRTPGVQTHTGCTNSHHSHGLHKLTFTLAVRQRHPLGDQHMTRAAGVQQQPKRPYTRVCLPAKRAGTTAAGLADPTFVRDPPCCSCRCVVCLQTR